MWWIVRFFFIAQVQFWNTKINKTIRNVVINVIFILARFGRNWIYASLVKYMRTMPLKKKERACLITALADKICRERKRMLFTPRTLIETRHCRKSMHFNCYHCFKIIYPCAFKIKRRMHYAVNPIINNNWKMRRTYRLRACNVYKIKYNVIIINSTSHCR